jgi:phage gp36-like protein
MADAYADQSDLARFGMMASASQPIPSAALDAQLLAASEVMNSYFRARYSLPLTDWDDSVRMYCCWIAAYLAFTMRGFSLDAGRDAQILERSQMAIDWCGGVEHQRIHPRVVETPVAEPRYQFPQISSSPKRGW